MEIYDGIMQGLQEAIAYSEGKITARTAIVSEEPVQKPKDSEENT